MALNRNKRSLAVDMGKPEGREIVLDLLVPRSASGISRPPAACTAAWCRGSLTSPWRAVFSTAGPRGFLLHRRAEGELLPPDQRRRSAASGGEGRVSWPTQLCVVHGFLTGGREGAPRDGDCDLQHRVAGAREANAQMARRQAAHAESAVELTERLRVSSRSLRPGRGSARWGTRARRLRSARARISRAISASTVSKRSSRARSVSSSRPRLPAGSDRRRELLADHSIGGEKHRLHALLAMRLLAVGDARVQVDARRAGWRPRNETLAPASGPEHGVILHHFDPRGGAVHHARLDAEVLQRLDQAAATMSGKSERSPVMRSTTFVTTRETWAMTGVGCAGPPTWRGLIIGMGWEEGGRSGCELSRREASPSLRKKDAFARSRDAIRQAPAASPSSTSPSSPITCIDLEPQGKSVTRLFKSLCISFAKRLNAKLAGKGPVFHGRYHLHVLQTPTEVRRALAYVLTNDAHHKRQSVPTVELGPYSSAHAFGACKSCKARSLRSPRTGQSPRLKPGSGSGCGRRDPGSCEWGGPASRRTRKERRGLSLERGAARTRPSPP